MNNQNLYDITNKILRGTFIVMNTHQKRQQQQQQEQQKQFDRLQITNLMMYLKVLNNNKQLMELRSLQKQYTLFTTEPSLQTTFFFYPEMRTNVIFHTFNIVPHILNIKDVHFLSC